MLRDSLKMEEGFAHDNADVLLLHDRFVCLLLIGPGRLAVLRSVYIKLDTITEATTSLEHISSFMSYL